MQYLKQYHFIAETPFHCRRSKQSPLSQASNSNAVNTKTGQKKAKRPNCDLSPTPWSKSFSPKRRKLSTPVFLITISEETIERNLDVVVVPDLSEIQRQM